LIKKDSRCCTAYISYTTNDYQYGGCKNSEVPLRRYRVIQKCLRLQKQCSKCCAITRMLFVSDHSLSNRQQLTTSFLFFHVCSCIKSQLYIFLMKYALGRPDTKKWTMPLPNWRTTAQKLAIWFPGRMVLYLQ